MRDRTRWGSGSKPAVFLCMLLLAGFNVALVLRTMALRHHLDSPRDNRVKLTIEEQLSILEHKMEGEDLRERLRQLMFDPDSARILGRGEPMLLYIIKTITCDRCLYNELTIFREFAGAFSRQKLNVAFLFSDIREEDFRPLVDSLGIGDIAFRERQAILSERFSGISQPMTLFVVNGGIILSANISNYYRDPSRTRRYLEKIMRFIVDPEKWPADETGSHP